MTTIPRTVVLPATASILAGERGPESPLDAASLLADDDARFTEVNDQAVNLLHYPREELLQMQVWDITPELQRPDAIDLWKAFIRLGEQSGVYQVRRRDGRRVTVDYVAVAHYRPGAHLSVLRPIGRSMGAGRALDECPYERPFPAGFRSCPAYQPHLTYESDSAGGAVAPLWTCHHLGAGRNPEGKGFFGRCGIGDALARTRWLAAARVTHLRAIQELRMAAADEVGAALEALYRSRAWRAPVGQGAATSRAIAQASARVTATFSEFASRRKEQFRAAGIDPTELSRCFALSIEDFGRTPTVEGWSHADAVVRAFPAGIRTFMRPDLYALGEVSNRLS